MLFNSPEFALFLPVVFGLYWLARLSGRTLANLVLLVASYVFYGWWNWNFLALIAVSSGVDYAVGRKLAETAAPSRRRLLLAVSLVFNFGLLFLFKYYLFAATNLAAAGRALGVSVELPLLDLILPVGISFYTFQTVSYTIDVYRGRMAPTKSLLEFFAYVSFFPQLVAGPIERASNLLPQFHTHRVFDRARASDGLRQILWGLFKKVVVADNCALLVNEVFSAPGDHPGSSIFLAAVLFAFQIYGDFSGYSDIAIGTARLFGFDLMQNFAFPYFSRDIAEFWRRWHISLSTWFRDYLYIPLGGSRGGKAQRLRNTFVIFLVSGFWHGANWTFIAWGAIHALLFVPLLLSDQNRRNLGVIAAASALPSPGELLQVLRTFLLVCGAWIFFRARDISEALTCLSRIASPSLLEPWTVKPSPAAVGGVAVLLVLEWRGRRGRHALAGTAPGASRPIRWLLYMCLIWSILLLRGASQEFIYFQF